jgi:hypothetical protein
MTRVTSANRRGEAVPNQEEAMSETIDRSELLTLTAEIVSAHVGN